MTKFIVPPILGHSAISGVAVPAPVSHVRGDHLVGAIASLSIILGAAWVGELTKGRGHSAGVALTEPTTRVLEMPWLEPDKPEVVQPDIAKTQTEVPPPVLPDILGPRRPNAFVQPFEPRPPSPVGIRGDIVIPTGPGRLNDVGKIFDLSQLDRQPVPISQTRPSYPYEMRRNGLSAQVMVDFIVDAAGHVNGAFAANSSNREFESAAATAVSKWRFQPGRKGGHAVKTHMQVPIVFSLKDES